MPDHQPSELDITLATVDDVPALVAIDEACFSRPTTDPAAELSHAWARLWVGRPRAQSTPVGFLLVWFAADEMHILTLATLEPYRRRGVGRALMTHGLKEARSRGARLALLEVRRSNAAAIQLYRTFGFAQTGVRSRYYDDGEDAVEMGLVLEAGTGQRERGCG